MLESVGSSLKSPINTIFASGSSSKISKSTFSSKLDVTARFGIAFSLPP